MFHVEPTKDSKSKDDNMDKNHVIRKGYQERVSKKGDDKKRTKKREINEEKIMVERKG